MSCCDQHLFLWQIYLPGVARHAIGLVQQSTTVWPVHDSSSPNAHSSAYARLLPKREQKEGTSQMPRLPPRRPHLPQLSKQAAVRLNLQFQYADPNFVFVILVFQMSNILIENISAFFLLSLTIFSQIQQFRGEQAFLIQIDARGQDFST